MDEFGEKLGKLMESANVTFRELSKKTGIPESTLWRWRNGQGIPDYWRVLTLANFFKVSADYFAKEAA